MINGLAQLSVSNPAVAKLDSRSIADSIESLVAEEVVT
jgi:hypothetical protein